LALSFRASALASIICPVTCAVVKVPLESSSADLAVGGRRIVRSYSSCVLLLPVCLPPLLFVTCRVLSLRHPQYNTFLTKWQDSRAGARIAGQFMGNPPFFGPVQAQSEAKSHKKSCYDSATDMSGKAAAVDSFFYIVLYFK
jgi:hypothetical protein